MARARWEIVDGVVRVWLETVWEDPSDPIYGWIVTVLDSRPFILQDYGWAPWNPAFAIAHRLATAHVRDRKERYLLYGGTDSAVLDEHRGLDNLGWTHGLRLFVLDTPDEMKQILAEWDGKRPEVTDQMDPRILFTLGIMADAECLVMTPGKVGVDQLPQAAEGTARKLGYEWSPLRPEGREAGP